MRKASACFSVCVVIATSIAIPAFAQMAAFDQTGPVPPAIAAAKTVFVSNAGSDSGLFPSPFTGEPDRPYNEFYGTLKATGAFTLAGDPAQADLVLELRLTAPYGPTNPNKVAGASDPLPMFRLVVYDGKTHYILWALTQSIPPVVGQKAHDKYFDTALTELLDQFLQIAGKAPAAEH